MDAFLESIIKDFGARLGKVESDQIRLFDRMGKVEDKASSAWKMINEVKEDVRELKEDMKEMKLAQAKQGKVLKTLCIVMCVLTVIVGGFFVYIWRHDAELAKSILSLGTTIGSLVA